MSEPESPEGSRLVTEDVIRSLPVGGRLKVTKGDIITPLARQVALEKKISFDESDKTVFSQPNQDSRVEAKSIAIGADHGGYELKGTLITFLKELGYAPVDCGTYSKDSVDYPDIAFAVAGHVAQGTAWRGIVIDGAGIGSCMAAN
ncbi:MAG: RpiB/LacA/LacB family sugar-phosphate isomerase, partial [Anaerolineales bacterium]|nr:RpiB/LacA/LacB family sugar-phosphate isomerase [Anaerolineales bacterium]